MYAKANVTLTGPQLKRMSEGYPVQLAAHQLKSGKHTLILHPLQAQRLHKAAMKGTGCRMCMNPHEIGMSGEGLGDIWNWAKKAVPAAYNWAAENAPKAYNWLESNVIQTPFYQGTIRPKLHNLGEQGIQMLPGQVRDIGEAGFDYLGDKSGAFGLKGSRKAPKRIAAKPAPKRGKGTGKKGGSFLIR